MGTAADVRICVVRTTFKGARGVVSPGGRALRARMDIAPELSLDISMLKKLL